MNTKVKSIITLTGTGTVIGLVYPLLADQWSDWLAFVIGGTIGLIGGALIGCLEIFLFTTKRRKLSFPKLVLGKALTYTFIFVFLILSVKAVAESFYVQESVFAYIKSEAYHNFVFNEDFHIIIFYTMCMVGALIFTRQMNNKLGKGLLLNFITGKYHDPTEERRIFLFIDLNSSTTLGDQLGPYQYYKLLNEFFYDMSDCIIENGGTVYRYVGDQASITWPILRNNNSRCLKCYYSIKNKMERLQEKYFDLFDFVPQFKASLHCGDVVRGEIGDLKSQIVFHGKVLFDTMKIEKMCGQLNLPVLLSEQMKELVAPPASRQYREVDAPASTLSFKLYTLEDLN